MAHEVVEVLTDNGRVVLIIKSLYEVNFLVEGSLKRIQRRCLFRFREFRELKEFLLGPCHSEVRRRPSWLV